MAIGRMKTAYDARLVGEEMLNASYELSMGIKMTGDADPAKIILALAAVGRDLIEWAGDKEDLEEVFIPVTRIAQIDQASAQFNDFIRGDS